MHLFLRENLPKPNSQVMHWVLSAFYVFAINILDSRVPWFPTLNNSKYEKVRYKTVSLKIKKKTVMHLVPWENLPEPNSQGMHCVLSCFYVFLVNISDSRDPWFPTLNNRKCKFKDKKENSHASCSQGKLTRTKFTRYELYFIFFVRVSSKYLGF